MFLGSTVQKYIYIALALLFSIVIVLLIFAHRKNWISANARNSLSWSIGIVAAICAVLTLLLDTYHFWNNVQSQNNGRLIVSQLGTSTSSKSAIAVTEPFIVKTALRLLYGENVEIMADDKSQEWYAQWEPTSKQAKEFFNDDSIQYIDSRVFMVLPFHSNNTDNYLILTTSVPDAGDGPLTNYSCHACAPLLGGAILTLQHGAWVVTAKTLHIGNIGQWGKTEQGNLVVIGRDRYAVLFQYTFMGQGDVDKSLVLVGQVGDQLKILLDVYTASSDLDGSCELAQDIAQQKHQKFNYEEWCYDYVSKHYFVVDSRSEYYDFVISYAGTDNDDTNSSIGTKDVSRIDIYSFNGDQYKLAKTIKQPPIDPLSFNELLY